MSPSCRTVRVFVMIVLFDSFVWESRCSALVYSCLPVDAIEPNMEHVQEKRARTAAARLAPPTAAAPKAAGERVLRCCFQKIRVSHLLLACWRLLFAVWMKNWNRTVRKACCTGSVRLDACHYSGAEGSK